VNKGKQTIRLVDTTLRDGQQAPGLAFSQKTRWALVKSLDSLGLAKIEAMYLGLTKAELSEAKKRSLSLKKSSIVAWNRLHTGDIEASMEAEPRWIHICFPVTGSMLTKKLRLTFSEAARLLEKCLALARKNSFETSVGLEDASRANQNELLEIKTLLKGLGVVDVRISDTVGLLTPGRTRTLVEDFCQKGFRVEFHAHNDLGLAGTNSLVAALSGASYIDTTLMGVGERAGNAGLSEFLALAELAPSLCLTIKSKKARELEEHFRLFLKRDEYINTLFRSPWSDITDKLTDRIC
jgi:homocitrate synthase NifV